MITLDNHSDDHVMAIMKANLKWIKWYDYRKGSRLVFMAFHGSRLVLHDSRLVFMFFHGFRSVFMVFMVQGWFFMVPGGFYGFSWFQVGFSWFQAGFMVPGGFIWFFMVAGWFFIVPVSFSWFFMV